jgi:hypothetical protein
VPPSVGYDASIGVGVDSSGFAHLPLRPGARRFFVSSLTGSDANNCAAAESPATPKRSLAAATECIVNSAGAGDQVMVAEGTSYQEGLPNLSLKFGFSPAYPTVVQSYDPADPFNEARHGRAGGARRPVVNMGRNDQVITSVMPGGSHFAIRGLDWNPGNHPGLVVSFVGTNSYVLIENNLFRYTTLTFDKGGGPFAVKHIIRKNAFFGSWSQGGHAQGLYEDGAKEVTIEDNVFWHNGWKIGARRDDDPSIGGPTMFRHSIYTQTGTSALVRRNVFADPAATGASVRGDVTLSENVFIDNPMAIFAGLGNDYNQVRPEGVSIDIGYNLILGDEDLNAANPRGQAINTANGKPGSSTHHNLIIRSRNPNAVNVIAFNNQAIYNQPSNMLFDSNIIYRFSPVIAGNGGVYPGQVNNTYTNNIWDASPTGTNVSSASAPFPNPLTAADAYLLLSCTDKPTCLNQMVLSPEQNWAPRIRTLMFQAYRLD